MYLYFLMPRYYTTSYIHLCKSILHLLCISPRYYYTHYYMKRFVILCLYKQCLIFLPTATNLVNINVLMILKCALLSLRASYTLFHTCIRLSNSLQAFSSITLCNVRKLGELSRY